MNEVSAPLVVALDGPSGSGKSSTARGVARALGLDFLDTGAMYRACTWAVLDAKVDLDDAHAITAIAERVDIVSGLDPDAPTIKVDGTDVAGPIRGDEVTAAVSQVAAVPKVRELMVAKQRSIIAASQGIVVEGRDIGTTVAPDAAVKVFLIADVAARAERRTAELGGTAAEVSATQASLARRDHKDSSRAASPLAQAEGSIVLDSTYLTLDEVIAEIVALVEAAR
ncbi:MAG: (d)CMP kinase [Nocardioidaceae bacterium]|nr:(d)CMP kinase [Nocardioidaceae bacterium]